MTHMTIYDLQLAINKLLLSGAIKSNYNIAVWVKDHGGKRAVDLLNAYHIDDTEGFVAFHLDWSQS